MEYEPERATRRAVLYVEDHPVNAMLMVALFRHCPMLRLVVARNGEEALHCARGLNPVLLLLDLRLPDCHGSALVPLLRRIGGCEHAPAIAVTADDEFDFASAGFAERWLKPMNLDHVLKRLDALTRGWQAPPLGARPAQPPRASPP